MANAWIQALKEYNKNNKTGFCIVKKGTKDYDEVKKLMEKMKANNKANNKTDVVK
jgi:hypothetical protein